MTAKLAGPVLLKLWKLDHAECQGLLKRSLLIGRVHQIFFNGGLSEDVGSSTGRGLSELEGEVKSLNAFLVHKGFAEEYIRWKGDV